MIHPGGSFPSLVTVIIGLIFSSWPHCMCASVTTCSGSFILPQSIGSTLSAASLVYIHNSSIDGYTIWLDILKCHGCFYRMVQTHRQTLRIKCTSHISLTHVITFCNYFNCVNSHQIPQCPPFSALARLVHYNCCRCLLFVVRLVHDRFYFFATFHG